MSVEQNKAFIRRYLDALSGKEKPAALVEQFVSDPGLQEHIAVAEAAFPRYRMNVEDLVAEGDRVVVRFTGEAKHLGDFMGVGPTGRDVTFVGIIIYRIAGEKIVEHWLQMDAIALMQQLTGEPALATSA